MILDLPTPRPYHAPHVFGFLGARALPGLETVQGLEYRRRLSAQDGGAVWLKARWRNDALRLHLPATAAGAPSGWIARVRRLFDLDADSVPIDRHLRADPLLAPWVRAALCRLPGIGPWTAAYIGLRVAKDADAFPAGDWVVRKVLKATAAEAAKRAAAWSPWRAYALMHLWHRAAQPDERKAAPSAGNAEFAGGCARHERKNRTEHCRPDRPRDALSA